MDRSGRSNRRDAAADILDATIKVLETSGEAAVRLASIADDAGVAIGLIGYHFGGREGLIEAAQAERYAERSLADLDAIESRVATAKNPDDLVGLLAELTLEAVAQATAEGSRLRRVALLGSAFGRPELLERYGALQGELTDRYERVVRFGQVGGLFRQDLDSRAIAVFAQAYAFGLVLSDIDPRGPGVEQLSQVIIAAVSGLLNPSASV
jgi:AcrR family transcriptional regulator